MSCDQNCSACGGCARELTLTEAEIEMLYTLGQIPFLPVARQVDDPTPIYLEDSPFSPEESSRILQFLEKKGLVDLDFRSPLRGMDPARYGDYPVQGSLGLTARGIAVLELLEIQGITE